MERDGRLMIAMLLFLASLIAFAIQAVIIQSFIESAVMEHWAGFIRNFSVVPPAAGPRALCFDYCPPHLPHTVGWIGIGTFIGGWITLALAWWKPNSAMI